MQNLKTCITKEPNNIEALVKFAEMKLKEEDVEEANEYIDKVL